MTVPKQDFDITADNDFPMSFTLTNEDGSPFDLTGATADMQVREKNTDAAIKETATGGIVDEAGGVIDFTLSDVQTRNMLPISEATFKYVYDIQITYADTTKETVVTGVMNMVQGVTRT